MVLREECVLMKSSTSCLPTEQARERCAFGSLGLGFDVPSFIQQDLHHANMTRCSSQDQRSETWGQTVRLLSNILRMGMNTRLL